jgi:hypothetical protein
LSTVVITPASADAIDLSASTPSEILAALNGAKETAAAEPAETAAEETPAAEETETSDAAAEKPAVETPAPDSETGKSQESDEDEVKSSKGLKKRFSKLTSEIRELRQQLDEAKKPAREAKEDSGTASPAPAKETTAAKPVLGDFDSYEAFNEALVDWKLAQKEQAHAAVAADKAAKVAEQNAQSAWQAKIAAAKIEDFDEVVGSAEITLPAPVVEGIMTSDVGPQIAYHLASHPDEAQALVQMTPVAAVRKLGQLEARFEAAAKKTTSKETPKPKTQPLPKPPAAVGGKSSSTGPDINDPKLSMHDFKRIVRTQLSRPPKF